MLLDKGLWPLLLQQFRKFLPWYLAALASLFLTHYLGSVIPFYAKELADLVSVGTEKIETSKYFLLALGIIIFRSLSRILFFYPARVVEKNMRIDILGRIENVNPLRYENYPPGQLFQVLYTDIEQIRALLGFACLQLGNIIMAVLVLVPRIYTYNSTLLWAIAPMVICGLIFSIVVAKTRHYYRRSSDLQGEVQNYIMETYAGKKTIKNYHSESSFIDIFKVKSFKELTYAFKAGIAVSFSVPLIPLGVGLSFLLGAYIIQAQSLGVTSLVLFSGFVFLFLEPLHFMAWIGVVFSSSLGSWSRIKELIHDLGKKSKREIQLEKLNSSLDKNSPEFKVEFWGDVLDLPVERKKWSVIIGKTGSGKSEIMLQLACILKEKGIDVSLIFQNPYIYDDTLESNIFLGRDFTPSEKDQAFELLKLFALDFLSHNKDELFKMKVGEHGKHLSGGQAKRLCLIRSIMSQAEFLLWDDPFSSVDVILEKEIIEKLKKIEAIKDKTLILSSHRISTVKQCDKLIFIGAHQGILEVGEPATLLKGNSQSYEYFEKQMV
jgi:ATP-binding cassette subfamily B protein